MTDYGYESTLRAFDVSRHKLGLEYLDLYLLHWPMPSDFGATIASYKAAESLFADGKIRAIGVSNFLPTHLQRLIERTEVVPAVNQIELHPFFIQRELRVTNARLGVVTESWSPPGRSVRQAAVKPGGAQDPLVHPTIGALAEKYNKDPGSGCAPLAHPHGLVTIPKSFRPERIGENIDIFDFALTATEVADIDSLDRGLRGGPDPNAFDLSRTNIRIGD